MPQYIKINKDNNLIGTLRTENCGGTEYNIFFNNTPLDGNPFDTGVERQPQDRVAMRQDFQDDSKHRKRSVGALAKSAEDIIDLIKDSKTTFEKVDFILFTNQKTRGVLTVTNKDILLSGCSLNIPVNCNTIEGAIKVIKANWDELQKKI